MQRNTSLEENSEHDEIEEDPSDNIESFNSANEEIKQEMREMEWKFLKKMR